MCYMCVLDRSAAEGTHQDGTKTPRSRITHHLQETTPNNRNHSHKANSENKLPKAREGQLAPADWNG